MCVCVCHRGRCRGRTEESKVKSETICPSASATCLLGARGSGRGRGASPSPFPKIERHPRWCFHPFRSSAFCSETESSSAEFRWCATTDGCSRIRPHDYLWRTSDWGLRMKLLGWWRGRWRGRWHTRTRGHGRRPLTGRWHGYTSVLRHGHRHTRRTRYSITSITARNSLWPGASFRPVQQTETNSKVHQTTVPRVVPFHGIDVVAVRVGIVILLVYRVRLVVGIEILRVWRVVLLLPLLLLLLLLLVLPLLLLHGRRSHKRPCRRTLLCLCLLRDLLLCIASLADLLLR